MGLFGTEHNNGLNPSPLRVRVPPSRPLYGVVVHRELADWTVPNTDSLEGATPSFATIFPPAIRSRIESFMNFSALDLSRTLGQHQTGGPLLVRWFMQ